MNIDEHEEELFEEDDHDEEDPEDRDQNDLWDALNLLDKSADLFDVLTAQSDEIDMPLKIELRAFRMAKKIREFVGDWDRRNTVEGEVIDDDLPVS